MTSATRRLWLGGCASALAAPFVRAQNTTRRLAIISMAAPVNVKPYREALSDGLRELGWIEGRNLIVDVRYAADPSQLPAAVAELLALKPDLVLSTGDESAKVASTFANAPPIVLAMGNDPVGNGLIKSFAHPGTKVTGFSIRRVELVPKRLSLLKEAVPTITKVGLLEYREGEPGSQQILSLLNEAAKSLGIRLLHRRVNAFDETEPIFESWIKQGVRAFATVTSPWFSPQQLSALGLRYRMAFCGAFVQGADVGYLISYGVDDVALFRRAAKLVGRILNGADPADIPMEQADTFQLVLNMRTARAIGVQFPRSLLVQATRVIE